MAVIKIETDIILQIGSGVCEDDINNFDFNYATTRLFFISFNFLSVKFGSLNKPANRIQKVIEAMTHRFWNLSGSKIEGLKTSFFSDMLLILYSFKRYLHT